MSLLVAEALYIARKCDKIRIAADNFNACHPDGERSQILSILTAQTDYAPNRTYQNTMRKSWLLLSWLVG